MSIDQKIPLVVSLSNAIQKKVDEHQQGLGFALPCTVTKVQGAIVTVNFEVEAGKLTFPPVTCPIAESTYVRLPVQVGDKGVCIPANARLGGISGLGLGLAPLSSTANLGSLIFVPIGNKNWTSVDPNAVNINAPNGAVIRDTENKCVITLTPTGTTVVIGNTNITITGSSVVTTVGSTKMTIDATGVTIDGKLTVNGLITGTQGFAITGGTGSTMNVTGNINQTGNFQNTGTIQNNGKNIGSTHTHSGVQPGSGNTGAPT